MFATKKINPDEVDLLGIIKETAPTKQCADDQCLGVSSFMRNYLPRADVYQNEDLTFYKALGNRSLLTSGLFGSWNPFNVFSEGKALGKRLEEKNITGNLKGEGLKLGGVIVFDREGGIVWSHQEKTGSQVPVDDLVAAVNGIAVSGSGGSGEGAQN